MKFRTLLSLVLATVLGFAGLIAEQAQAQQPPQKQIYTQADFPDKPEYHTAADCSAGRHWEAAGHGLNYPHCVCNSDSTHTPTANNQDCPVCSGKDWVQTTYPLNADGFTWGPANQFQTVIQANAPQCGPTIVSQGCQGSTYVIHYSDGTSTSTANSSQCVSVVSQGCQGTTFVIKYSDGSSSNSANDSRCAHVTTNTSCVGTTLMQNWSDGTQTQLATNSPACGWVAPTKTSLVCVGTSQMQDWSDGTQTLVAANSPACAVPADCSSQQVSWTSQSNICSGTAQATATGSLTQVLNVDKRFKGQASFLCTNGTFQYQSGSCDHGDPPSTTGSLPSTILTTWSNYNQGFIVGNWPNISQNGCNIPGAATNINSSYQRAGISDTTVWMASWTCGETPGYIIVNVCGGMLNGSPPFQRCN